MSFISATHGSIMHAILFFTLSFLALHVSANCNNDKCLKALNSDLVAASSFCSTYTTNAAISTPSAISSGCKASSSKILSACSCINTATTTSKTSSTGLVTAKTSSSSHTTSVTTSRATSSTSSRSTSTSNAANLPSTVTVTIVSTKSVTVSQSPNSITLPASTTTTTLTVSTSATCTTGAPCSLYENVIPSCVLSHIQQDFADFQAGCFGVGIGPSYVKTCICPYLSQLPAFFSSTGFCAAADVTTGLAYQQSECQCLGATIG